MRDLTPAEKQKLTNKISEENRRQAELQAMIPEAAATSTDTGFISNLCKYGFLAIILCLIAFNVILLLAFQNFAIDQYGNLMISLMVLFNHIGFNLMKKGKKRRVMRIVAGVWTVLGCLYIIWIYSHILF